MDVFLSVRSDYDQEAEKARAFRLRETDAPHPYVNRNAVDRYLTVVGECMDAQLAWRRTP